MRSGEMIIYVVMRRGELFNLCDGKEENYLIYVSVKGGKFFAQIQHNDCKT